MNSWGTRIATKQVDLKKECRELLQGLSNILPKFSFIDQLPVKKDKDCGVKYSEDFLVLQDIRHDLSILKWRLQNFIDQKNSTG